MGLCAGWALIGMLAAASGRAMTREGGDAARTALTQGKADEALRLLDTELTQNPQDAEARNLRCRVLFAEERWDDAIQECERAVQIAPGSSVYHMWLGRAYGEKASRVTFVAAYKMAKLIRAEFEEAVRLDPRNGEAMSDLGQYYVEAPAVLGGGTGKAEALAQQMDAFAPGRAHDLRGRIAEQKKDYVTAEKEFRAKIGATHSSAQSWMDLGSFYRRRERWDEMQAAVESGSVAAENHGPELVDGASTLIAANRELKTAADWMRQYLAGNSLSEDAPAFIVHARLGDLLKKLGDESGAAREYAASRTLATDYAGVPGVKAAGR